MYFPTSGIQVSLWVPPLVAFGISFFMSMGGVSGAFLLLPFQMSFLGFTNPSVSATNQVYNVVAIPGGVYRYFREGRMVWPLAVAVVLGTLPGVFIGAIVRIYWLPDARNFKSFAACVLFYIGGRMIWGLLRERLRGSGDGGQPGSDARHASKTSGRDEMTGVSDCCFTWQKTRYVFQGKEYSAPTPLIFALSFVVGIVGGTYGIGGGSIMAPFFVSMLHLPVHTVAGAALLGTFVTSVAGVIFYQCLAPMYPGMSIAPDWMLGILFGLGGLAGTYLGARCQRYVPAGIIKWMLGGVIVFTALKYVQDFWG
ncbi:MAG: sulfite exporter TauE/SafE family protein [Desulfoplanes sp.]